MPVSVWNMLPDNPAYMFVGFVTTRNLTEEIRLQVLEARFRRPVPKSPAYAVNKTDSSAIMVY
jgi:hypothetical protein